MAGQDEGGAVALVVTLHEVTHGRLHRDVEADGGLVEEEHLGPVDERRAELAFHALAERERPRGPLHDLLDLEELGELADGGFELGARHVVHGAIELEGLARRQVPQELLLLTEDEHDLLQKRVFSLPRLVPVDAHLAARRMEEAGENLQRRGLSCTVRP